MAETLDHSHFHRRHPATLMTKPAGTTQGEPRWPALVAVAAVGCVHLSIPANLSFGPTWLPLVAVVLLMIPTVITYRRNIHDINYVLGHIVAGTLTLFLVGSLVMLVRALPLHTEQPTELLRSAVALWFSNILVFALWYWRLDAGGPHHRDLRMGHCNGSFLFPQMMVMPDMLAELGQTDWQPGFVDYLFVAFNASAAFSPTDTAVLSRWAKIMMMVQATISLAVMALLAARAVNIL
jgi:hypothetical protein